jgi:transposase
MRDQWGMSNVLKVSLLAAIYSLHNKGWPQRRIARELGLNRQTVGRYLRLAKPAISTAGAIAGRKSQCEPLAETILAKVEVGLSAQPIYQDLVEEEGFADSYESVKRFVRKLRASHPERVWRLECQPGEELQLDFGSGAPIDEGQGKTRRSWILRLVLSYSRKGYSEALYRQDTDTFLRCLENGLRSFGGTPLLLNLDNFKATVRNADWFDPDINPKLADFCRHYGMHVVPCRPGKPEHKGKVERGIAYLRSNALKGRRFKSLSEQNRFLSHWESHVADKRIHGTTHKQVMALIRVANLRHQAMVEPEFRMILLRSTVTAEGDDVRRFRSLTLEFDRLITFPAVLTVRHRIDEESPLFGMTPADFQQQDIRIVASIVGVETVIVAPVQDFGDYNYDQIEWNRRFVEIYGQNEEGEWTVDYGRIEETEDVAPIPNLAKDQKEQAVPQR